MLSHRRNDHASFRQDLDDLLRLVHVAPITCLDYIHVWRRILVRDGFRCQSCGVSPLTKPGTELHVDHVIPWSKGGETVDENLGTKCLQCNLGKGNAFDV